MKFFTEMGRVHEAVKATLLYYELERGGERVTGIKHIAR